MSKKRSKPAARKAAKPSTALAVQRRTVTHRVEVLPSAAAPAAAALANIPANELSEHTSLGALGLAEVKLTAEENRILNKPIDVSEIRMKPSGQPYLSHPSYTRWFNDAFGRLGWTLVPASKPIKTDKGVARDFLLYVHGQPAAFATGEQDYIESNREQSYGDALEACFANALRRCAKRLGVGLEMWDRAFIDAYVAEHCVKVKVVQKFGNDRKQKYLWRRKVDAPFWNEVGTVGHDEDTDDDDGRQTQRRAAPAPPARQESPKDNEPITHGSKNHPGQLERLWVIIRNSGRNEEVIREWLERRYGYTSSKDIKRKHYDEICKAIEARGNLPAGQAREPGQEG